VTFDADLRPDVGDPPPGIDQERRPLSRQAEDRLRAVCAMMSFSRFGTMGYVSPYFSMNLSWPPACPH
jgi:hypothetical protein